MLQQAPYMSENLVLSARDSGKKLNKTGCQGDLPMQMTSKSVSSAEIAGFLGPPPANPRLLADTMAP